MKLHIKTPPYQGEYDFDVGSFTAREWGWIISLTGYTPLTIDDGMADPRLLCVFGAIALRRAGKLDNTQITAAYERLIDDPAFENIDIEQPEDDADPPPSSNSSTSISGDGSPTSSATSATSPNGTGTPGSDTSLSAPPALVT